MGNYLADFLRNKDIPTLPKSFLRGIELHRKIDSFTDAHPAVLEVNKLFHEVHHKYAPVVTDVLFDLVLARNWSDYSGEDINDFVNGVYKTLNKHRSHFPERRKQTMINMIDGGFLMKYTNIEGLRFTFEHLDRRTKGRGKFVQCLDNLDNTYPKLEAAFKIFFPELITEVDAYCDC
jgi:acyl carrier protein phosphodiesterase